MLKEFVKRFSKIPLPGTYLTRITVHLPLLAVNQKQRTTFLYIAVALLMINGLVHLWPLYTFVLRFEKVMQLNFGQMMFTVVVTMISTSVSISALYLIRRAVDFGRLKAIRPLQFKMWLGWRFDLGIVTLLATGFVTGRYLFN